MNELDIVKGVSALKTLAVNLRSAMEHTEEYADTLLVSLYDEMNKSCEILTDIFEKAFTDMIAEKERLDDDGK